MLNRTTGSAVSGLTLLAVVLAGCTIEGVAGTGTVVFCVQDEATGNFSGVFVNFGSIQINQQVGGEETTATGGTTNATTTNATATAANTTATATGTTSPTAGTATTTTTAATATTTAGTGTTTTGTAPTGTTTTGTGFGTEQPAQTIQVGDVECQRVTGTFEGVFRGQVGQDGDRGIGNDDQGRRQIDVEAEEIDLMKFQGRRAAFLAEARVPAGTFHQFAISVDDVRAETGDGRNVTVDVPSDTVRLVGPVMVEEERETLVVLKVDLQRSFVQTTSDRVIFQPVIHVRASAPSEVDIVILDEDDAPSETTTATNMTTTATMTNTTATSPTTTAAATTTTATTTAATSPTTTSPYP